MKQILNLKYYIIIFHTNIYAMIALALANRNRNNSIINHNTYMINNKREKEKEIIKNKNKLFGIFNKIKFRIQNIK